MTIWFLGFLALIWIAFFLPGAERARRQTPLAAAHRFKRVMRRVAPARPAPRHRAPRRRSRPAARRARTDSGRWIIVPEGRHAPYRSMNAARSRRRRRHLLAILLAAAVGTAVVAVWKGGPWRELHLIADGILIFYVAMLFEAKRRREERTAKVRRLQDQRPEDRRMFEHVEAGSVR